MFFESETGIAGETFGVGTQRLQEALNLDADLVVAGHLIFSRLGISRLNRSGSTHSGSNLSRRNLFDPSPTHFGLHFQPTRAEQTWGGTNIETLRCLPILPIVKTRRTVISFAEGDNPIIDL